MKRCATRLHYITREEKQEHEYIANNMGGFYRVMCCLPVFLVILFVDECMCKRTCTFAVFIILLSCTQCRLFFLDLLYNVKHLHKTSIHQETVIFTELDSLTKCFSLLPYSFFPPNIIIMNVKTMPSMNVFRRREVK